MNSKKKTCVQRVRAWFHKRSKRTSAEKKSLWKEQSENAASYKESEEDSADATFLVSQSSSDEHSPQDDLTEESLCRDVSSLTMDDTGGASDELLVNLSKIPLNYKLVRILGAGSTAALLLCRTPGTSKDVALKIPKHNDVSSLEMEAKIFYCLTRRKMATDSIVEYHGEVYHNNTLSLEFEALDINMLEYTNTHGSLKLDDVRTVIKTMAVALETLNDMYIIHTDIKMEHIMFVDHINQPFKVKLIDLGSAIQSKTFQYKTSSKQYACRAPELLLHMPCSKAVDVWSLGCTMAHMLYRELFTSCHPYQTLQFIVELVGPPPQHMINDMKFPEILFKKTDNLWELKTLSEISGFDVKLKDNRCHNLRSLDDLKRYIKANKELQSEAMDDCIDLLRSMLEWDPRLRITIQEILSHPFIIGRINDSALLNDLIFGIVSSDSSSMDEKAKVPTSYEVLKKSGAGSYGVVLICKENGSDRTVAMKVAKARRASALVVEAMMHRTLMWHELDKANIVKYHGEVRELGLYGLIFEQLDTDMENFLKNNTMRLEDIRYVTQQLAETLDALKNKLNLIHTDIKLDNIMLVDHANQPFRIKLIDFGLAMYARLATPGDLRQPVPFRAPEIILKSPYSEAIDMWSLGCLLAQMLLGGKLLFPTTKEYEAISFMIDFLGPPPQHLFASSTRPQKYFKCVNNLWVLKSPANFVGLDGFSVKRQYNFTNLSEMKSHLENRYPNEGDALEKCMDLVGKLIQWDPNDRLTPQTILSHSFVADALAVNDDSSEASSASTSQQAKDQNKPMENQRTSKKWRNCFWPFGSCLRRKNESRRNYS